MPGSLPPAAVHCGAMARPSNTAPATPAPPSPKAQGAPATAPQTPLPPDVLEALRLYAKPGNWRPTYAVYSGGALFGTKAPKVDDGAQARKTLEAHGYGVDG